MSVAFEEDMQGLFLSSDPRTAPAAPEEQLSVERLTLHISRFKAVIGMISSWFTAYNSIMDWEEPTFTGFLFVAFLYTTIKLNAEYALCAPIFIIVVLITKSFLNRRSGRFRKHWIEKGGDFEDKFRPTAVLRISVVGIRNFPDAAVTTLSPPSKTPFAKITYLPISEEDPSANTTATAATAPNTSSVYDANASEDYGDDDKNASKSKSAKATPGSDTSRSTTGFSQRTQHAVATVVASERGGATTSKEATTAGGTSASSASTSAASANSARELMVGCMKIGGGAVSGTLARMFSQHYLYRYLICSHKHASYLISLLFCSLLVCSVPFCSV
jgi:hypothetical protein